MGVKVKQIRITRTKESIFEAFVELMNEKDFEKITIQNLTERAEINRSTFYAHFQDKYELLDEIIGNSAVELIQKHTNGVCAFTKENMRQLVYAAFEYHQQVKVKCRRSYDSIIPLLRSQMIDALKHYLNRCLEKTYTEERSLYVQIYATMICDAVNLMLLKQTNLSEQKIAEHVVHLMEI